MRGGGARRRPARRRPRRPGTLAGPPRFLRRCGPAAPRTGSQRGAEKLPPPAPAAGTCAMLGHALPVFATTSQQSQTGMMSRDTINKDLFYWCRCMHLASPKPQSLALLTDLASHACVMRAQQSARITSELSRRPGRPGCRALGCGYGTVYEDKRDASSRHGYSTNARTKSVCLVWPFHSQIKAAPTSLLHRLQTTICRSKRICNDAVVVVSRGSSYLSVGRRCKALREPVLNVSRILEHHIWMQNSNRSK